MNSFVLAYNDLEIWSFSISSRPWTGIRRTPISGPKTRFFGPFSPRVKFPDLRRACSRARTLAVKT